MIQTEVISLVSQGFSGRDGTLTRYLCFPKKCILVRSWDLCQWEGLGWVWLLVFQRRQGGTCTHQRNQYHLVQYSWTVVSFWSNDFGEPVKLLGQKAWYV